MYSQIFSLHANLLKALAHPRRLEIVHLLRDQELPVTDIHTMLDLPQANISQHLMILRDAAVVSTRKEGKQVRYKLSSPKVLAACDLLRELVIAQHAEAAQAGSLIARMQDLVPLTQDPVCGMRVSPKTAGFHREHDHHHYYFCASGCVKAFEKEPDRYASTKK